MVDQGMKEMVRTLQKIKDHLEDISKSLSTLVKIQNRQFPNLKEPYIPKPKNQFGEEGDDEDEV